jgi:hypothetical protein
MAFAALVISCINTLAILYYGRATGDLNYAVACINQTIDSMLKANGRSRD